jgi:hypothetical protein
MALIGTISGSNGTSTTAISGSLVIADAPASSFPRLTGGVKFLVSGSKNADRTDNSQFLFDVDVFHSGAIGSNQFMQFKPVGALQIPTNTTASYIYTSGSTNDLYFTQYQPGTGFTNTTRLRWLESVLGTGLLRGGTLSTENGSTTFSVVSGSGIIITQNASLGVDPFPTIANITWASVVSQSLTYVASNQITYISIDSLGTVNQSPNPPTIAEKESNIYLGRILHQAGSVTNGSISEPAISYGLGESTFNFQRAFGPLKVSGHVLTATASNGGTRTLGLNKTAGDTYAEGRNYTLNPNSPNLVLSANDPALTTSKIFREYTNSSGDPVILNNGGAGYEEIDPSQYNNGGTLDAVNNSEWTNQRVYWFPRSVNRALFVYYGPQKYVTFDDAISGISTETFAEGANTAIGSVFVGVITVNGNATDLTSPTTTRITQAALHRGAGIGGGGGGGSTSPGGSNTYVQFNDASDFSGTNDFRFLKSTGTVLAANLVVTGSGAGSLVASGTMQVKGAAGQVVGYVSSTGEISGSGNIDSGGAITAAGNLRSINSSGDEGGEIFLSKSVTNTTLTGGVTIDVWQNRLRMFEQGGSARGYYLDISKGGDSVTSDLFRGDPMFSFLNRRVLIAQVEDSAASGFFGMFPYDIATQASNTSSVLGNTDATMAFTSLATANSCAAWRTNSTWARIGHTGRMRARLLTGADITSQTITFGLGTGTSTTGAGNSFSYSPAESQILIVYDSATSGNWLLLTKDGTTANTVSTGVSVSANTEYFIEINFTGSSVSLSVNGSTPVSSSTNLPAAGTSLYTRAGINPTTNASRVMYISRMVFEAGQVSTY